MSGESQGERDPSTVLLHCSSQVQLKFKKKEDKEEEEQEEEEEEEERMSKHDHATILLV